MSTVTTTQANMY